MVSTMVSPAISVSFGQAGALESLVLALRHHNDPESLRCLAATLSTLLSDDPGLLRLRAVEAGGCCHRYRRWVVEAPRDVRLTICKNSEGANGMIFIFICKI